MKIRTLAEIWKNRDPKQERIGVMNLNEREPFVILNCDDQFETRRFETFSKKFGVFYISGMEAQESAWLEWPEALNLDSSEPQAVKRSIH